MSLATAKVLALLRISSRAALHCCHLAYLQMQAVFWSCMVVAYLATKQQILAPWQIQCSRSEGSIPTASYDEHSSFFFITLDHT